MSVQSDTSRIEYVGNNSTVTDYPVPFYFLADSHLRVIVRNAAGAESSLSSGVDFTATGAGNPSGGGLTTVVAVPASSTIVIYREVPGTQLIQFEEADKFPAQAFERALDLLTMLSQQNQRVDTRAIRVRESDGALPDLAPAANSLLGMDASGNPKAMTLSEVTTYLGLLGSTLSVPAGARTFADDGERALAVPEFVGQLATQRDTQVVYLSTGTNAGDWALISPAADGAITAAKLASDAVTTVKLLNSAVTAAKIADAAITTAKVANAAITTAKLAPGIIIPKKGYLYGLTISNNVSDAANDIDIAAGECVTSSGVFFAVAAMTKRSDALWTAGNNGGGMDAGSKPASGTLHVFAISNGTSGDILLSTSATAPAMPAGYTASRRIGAVLTDGSGDIRGFFQHGDTFALRTRALDRNGTVVGTTAVLQALTVPDGVKVAARFQLRSSGNAYVFATSPDETDQAPTSIYTADVVSTGTFNQFNELVRLTNTARQIRLRSDTSGPGVGILTSGWIDTRGRLAD
jgi:hypothetical protein